MKGVVCIPFLFLLFLCCYSEIHCNSYIIFNNEGTCNENFIIGYPADNNCYGSNFTHAGNHYDGLNTYWDTDSCTIDAAFYTKAGSTCYDFETEFSLNGNTCFPGDWYVQSIPFSYICNCKFECSCTTQETVRTMFPKTHDILHVDD